MPDYMDGHDEYVDKLKQRAALADELARHLFNVLDGFHHVLKDHDYLCNCSACQARDILRRWKEASK